MRIIHGPWGYHRNPLTNPFREFKFHLVPLIPYSAIVKTILVRTRIFHIFTRVKNQPLKQLLLLLLGNQPSINGARPAHKQANAQAGLARVPGPSSCPLFRDFHMVYIFANIVCVYHISWRLL